MIVFLTNGIGTTVLPCAKEKKNLDTDLTPFTKLTQNVLKT